MKVAADASWGDWTGAAFQTGANAAQGGRVTKYADRNRGAEIA